MTADSRQRSTALSQGIREIRASSRDLEYKRTVAAVFGVRSLRYFESILNAAKLEDLEGLLRPIGLELLGLVQENTGIADSSPEGSAILLASAIAAEINNELVFDSESRNQIERLARFVRRLLRTSFGDENSLKMVAHAKNELVSIKTRVCSKDDVVLSDDEVKKLCLDMRDFVVYAICVLEVLKTTRNEEEGITFVRELLGQIETHIEKTIGHVYSKNTSARYVLNIKVRLKYLRNRIESERVPHVFPK